MFSGIGLPLLDIVYRLKNRKALSPAEGMPRSSASVEAHRDRRQPIDVRPLCMGSFCKNTWSQQEPQQRRLAIAIARVVPRFRESVSPAALASDPTPSAAEGCSSLFSIPRVLPAIAGFAAALPRATRENRLATICRDNAQSVQCLRKDRRKKRMVELHADAVAGFIWFGGSRTASGPRRRAARNRLASAGAE